MGQKWHYEVLGFKQMNALLQSFHRFDIGARRPGNDVGADVDDGQVDVAAHNQTQNRSDEIAPNRRNQRIKRTASKPIF